MTIMRSESYIGSEILSLNNRLCITENIILRYKLIKTEDSFLGYDEGYNEVYSILIIKTQDNVDCEVQFLYDISRTEDIAERILRLLCENSVTPNSAQYILDDIL